MQLYSTSLTIVRGEGSGCTESFLFIFLALWLTSKFVSVLNRDLEGSFVRDQAAHI